MALSSSKTLHFFITRSVEPRHHDPDSLITKDFLHTYYTHTDPTIADEFCIFVSGFRRETRLEQLIEEEIRRVLWLSRATDQPPAFDKV